MPLHQRIDAKQSRVDWLVSEIKGIRKYLRKLDAKSSGYPSGWRHGQRKHYRRRLKELVSELNDISTSINK